MRIKIREPKVLLNTKAACAFSQTCVCVYCVNNDMHAA